MQRRQFLSAFTVAAGGFALAGTPVAAARAMSLEPAPAHLRLAAPPADGALDWELLAAAGPERFRDGAISRFPATLRDLDGQPVLLSGYMMPIRQEAQHREFLLGGLQFHCAGCMMGDLGRIVAVRSRKPVALTGDPLQLHGTLRLLEGQASALYYRLDDARPV